MPREFQQAVWNAPLEDDCRQLVRLAVREDLRAGHDWTTLALVDGTLTAAADVVARQSGVVAGIEAARIVLTEYDPRLNWAPRVTDGATVEAGQVIARVHGSARSLLTAERPLLNFLGRLSGVATLAARYVAEVGDAHARIYDTRKTTPGWRSLEKYAVRVGGAWNHRAGLHDAILIKDNHLACLARSAEHATPVDALRMARAFLRAGEGDGGPSEAMLVEVEVDSLEQLRQVLPERPDIVLLDNMRPAELRAAVEMRNTLAPGVQLEASGGVRLETVRAIAETGVDRISAGELTHGARWLDVALDWAAMDAGG